MTSCNVDRSRWCCLWQTQKFNLCLLKQTPTRQIRRSSIAAAKLELKTMAKIMTKMSILTFTFCSGQQLSGSSQGQDGKRIELLLVPLFKLYPYFSFLSFACYSLPLFLVNFLCGTHSWEISFQTVGWAQEDRQTTTHTDKPNRTRVSEASKRDFDRRNYEFRIRAWLEPQRDAHVNSLARPTLLVSMKHTSPAIGHADSMTNPGLIPVAGVCVCVCVCSETMWCC